MTRGELRMLIRISWDPTCMFYNSSSLLKIGLPKSKSIRKIFTCFISRNLKDLSLFRVSDFHWPDKKWHWFKMRNWQNLRSNIWTQLKLLRQLRIICSDLYSVLLFTFLLTTVFPLALLYNIINQITCKIWRFRWKTCQFMRTL